MAVYKVIQDIEAEDKLLGPLTLKGFIYASITVLLGFINFKLVTAYSLGGTRFLFLAVFIWPMLLFAVLASPLGGEQPTEVWLLSHIRFLLKSRERVWDKDGVKQLVTVTAPKKVETHIGKDISQKEVKSRLKALANTLDSRGWAVKNVSVASNSLISYLQGSAGDSDRLVAASAVIQDQPSGGIQASDDIMDAQSNAKAKHIDKLLKEDSHQRKTQLIDGIQQVPPKLPKSPKSSANSHQPTAKSTPPGQAVKLKELAQSGNALSVATVANLANSDSHIKQISANEVEIDLH